jgi:5-methylcytosine-specific restriction endonuclease McrA
MPRYQVTKHSYLGSAEWKRIRLRVLIRDQYVCAYCGEVADQVDHVEPRSAGGSNDMDNLVACCRRCNIAKGGVRKKSVFLGTSATPPVFPDLSLPETVGTIPDSPFDDLGSPDCV